MADTAAMTPVIALNNAVTLLEKAGAITTDADVVLGQLYVSIADRWMHIAAGLSTPPPGQPKL